MILLIKIDRNQLVRPATILRVVLSFFTALVFIITLVWLPPWSYICEKYFVMRNRTLTHLTPSGKKQKILRIPECTEQIGDYAFYGNKVLKAVYLPNLITTISEYAFDHVFIFRNETCFYVANPNIAASLTKQGIPENQICRPNQKSANH